MNEEAQFKDKVRSSAGYYKKKGILIQKPCQVCGDENSQMHHENYNKPLGVTWLCRKDHLALHKAVA
jgi:hypothetical protein